MQNLSIPIQTINSATPEATDNTSSLNKVLSEDFSKIMAQEMANDAPSTQQNNTTLAVEQIPLTTSTVPPTAIQTAVNTKIPSTSNLQQNLVNQLQATSSEKLVSGKNIEQSIVSEHKYSLENSLEKNQQTTQSTLSPPTIDSQKPSLSLLEKTNTLANFAAFSKLMPPTTEIVSNAALSEPTTLLTADTIQSMHANGTAVHTSTPSSSLMTPATQSVHDTSLETQFGQPKWGDDFAQKIVWLTNQHQQTAEIKLNPVHLGPIEIMLSISNEQNTQANAQFVSSHPSVREAIESALPKLREMMAENGITLGNVTVDSNLSQQHNHSRQQENLPRDFLSNQSNNNHEPTGQSIATVKTNNHLGIVNTFA